MTALRIGLLLGATLWNMGVAYAVGWRSRGFRRMAGSALEDTQ
jgi:hypothetical protein